MCRVLLFEFVFLLSTLSVSLTLYSILCIYLSVVVSDNRLCILCIQHNAYAHNLLQIFTKKTYVFACMYVNPNIHGITLVYKSLVKGALFKKLLLLDISLTPLGIRIILLILCWSIDYACQRVHINLQVYNNELWDVIRLK